MFRWTKVVLPFFTAGSEKWLQFSTEEDEGAPNCKEENASGVVDRL